MSVDYFVIYLLCFRCDRYRHGDGISIYVREDTPKIRKSKIYFQKIIVGIFIEINLRKTKFVILGTYNSAHSIYGVYDDDMGCLYL